MKRSIPKRPEAWFKLSPFLKMDVGATYNNGRDRWRQGFPPLVLGGRSTSFADPSYAVLAHEMGHVVDIDDKRVTLPDYGLRQGKWHSWPTRYSSGYWEMESGDAVRREVKVTAIQAAIVEHWGFEFDYVAWAGLLDIMDGYFYWRNSLGLSYKDDTESRRNPSWGGEFTSLAPLVDASALRSLRATLTIEDIWTEWVRKTKVIETQIKAQQRRDHARREAAAGEV